MSALSSYIDCSLAHGAMMALQRLTGSLGNSSDDVDTAESHDVSC